MCLLLCLGLSACESAPESTRPARAVAPVNAEAEPDPATAPPAWTHFDPGSSDTMERLYRGLWSRRHSVWIANERPEASVTVSDELMVCGSPGHGYEFSFGNWGNNEHACAMRGTAGVNFEGDLVIEVDRIEPPACRLRVSTGQNGLRIEESWPQDCELMDCGANMRVLENTFSRRTRRQRPCTEIPATAPFG